jgi:hypothetical protein
MRMIFSLQVTYTLKTGTYTEYAFHELRTKLVVQYLHSLKTRRKNFFACLKNCQILDLM